MLQSVTALEERKGNRVQKLDEGSRAPAAKTFCQASNTGEWRERMMPPLPRVSLLMGQGIHNLS